MKTVKLGATIVLLLFVGATIGMLIAQEVSRPEAAPIADEALAGPASASGTDLGAKTREEEPTVPPATTDSIAGPSEDTACVIDAIYFHNSFRCPTCLKIESDAKAVIEAEFLDQLADGRMRWSAVNMEEQRRFVEQYDLVKPTLILTRSVGGEPYEWVALDETWTLVRSETRFSMYIANGVRAFLEGCP